jgi:hypothetical protein
VAPVAKFVPNIMYGGYDPTVVDAGLIEVTVKLPLVVEEEVVVVAVAEEFFRIMKPFE